MNEQTYGEGLRDGKISALEDIAANHKDRLDSHSSRLTLLERIMWAGAGLVFMVEFVPKFSGFMKLFSAG